MAIAGRWLAQHFNRPRYKMFDFNVFVLCGDGDMEGVTSEAAVKKLRIVTPCRNSLNE
jgi:transketolase